MKSLLLTALAVSILSSCSPVLHQDLMRSGMFNIPPSRIKEDPGSFRGKLFILGGIIVDTKVTADGSMIEAVFVPVNSMGYLKNINVPGGRFLALYPTAKGLLDPIIFHSDREITLAVEFIGMRSGKIGEMVYTYPFFEIKDLYLWSERVEYYIAPPIYPYWDYPYRYYEPWPHYDPWWRYH